MKIRLMIEGVKNLWQQMEWKNQSIFMILFNIGLGVYYLLMCAFSLIVLHPIHLVICTIKLFFRGMYKVKYMLVLLDVYVKVAICILGVDIPAYLNDIVGRITLFLLPMGTPK